MRRVEVVGAVIVEDGRVFCTRRGRGALAGLWEFPGGKVEPDESPPDALVREIREELGCSIRVGAKVVAAEHEYDFAVVALTTYVCRLVEGRPTLSEHTESCWLPPSDLGTLEWAAADLPTIELLSRR